MLNSIISNLNPKHWLNGNKTDYRTFQVTDQLALATELTHNQALEDKRSC